MATTSTKSARRVKEIDAGSDSEGANEAFEAAQKKLRVAGSTNEDGEVSLKCPKTENEDDEEFARMLWGDSKMTGQSSSSKPDDEEPDTKKRRVPGINRNRANPKSLEVEEGEGENKPLFTMQRGNSKKIAAEARELDKSEALVLQCQQLKHQIQDPRSVMQVTIAKVSAMLEKLNSRLTEDATKVLVDIIKVEGSSSRASTVWQSLKDAHKMLSGISDFVEALHDHEAGPDTLSVRASALRDLDVRLPANVNTVLCRRSADDLVNRNQLKEFFDFLSPDKKDLYPSGVASVLPSAGTDPSKCAEIIREFQSGCITHCLHNLLLRDFSAPPSDQKLLVNQSGSA